MVKRWNLIVSLVLQAAFFTLFVSVAVAQERTRVRVVVEKFMGSKANRVRGYVVGALNKRKDIELVPLKDVVAALKRLGVTLDSEEGYVALSRELEVNAFVDGEVTRTENRWTASLWVRQGNGKFVGQHNWENRKPNELVVIKKALWNELGEVILNAQIGQQQSETQPRFPLQEEADQPLPDGSAGPVSPDALSETRGVGTSPDKRLHGDEQKRLPTALSMRLSFGASWRNNSYEPEEAEQPYHYYNAFLEAAPWLAIHTKWFPAAHFSDEWFAHIGLAADFGIGLGAGSVYEDPESDEHTEPGTTSFTFSGGVLGRIPIDPVEIGLTVAYGQRVFKTSGFDGLPDVAHSFLRLGAMCDISVLGGLGVDLAIAYLQRLDSGEIASNDYFPEMSGGGVEGGIGVYYKVVDWLSIHADWSFQYFSFDTGASDAFEDVTGADDAYYTAEIGIGYDLSSEP